MPTPAPAGNAGSSALDRLWSERPHVPRALAGLIAFLESQDAVTEALADGAGEVAARLLADTYEAKEEFEVTYGVDWRRAEQLFERITLYGTEQPEAHPGEAVEVLPAGRMMERLGYIDGRRGWVDSPEAPKGWSPEQLTGDGPPEHEVGVAGAQRIVDERLNPAYERGHRFGTAERALCEEHEDVMRRMDTACEQALDENRPSAASLRAMAKGLEGIASERSPYTESGQHMRRYAEGRYREARRTLARIALAPYLEADTVTPRLPAASLLRVLAREARGMDGSEEAGREQALLDQVEECVLLLSASGFTPTAVAALLEKGEPDHTHRSPEEILREERRDLDRANLVRTVLAQINTPVKGARAWRLPKLGPPEITSHRRDRRARGATWGTDELARCVLAVRLSEDGGEAQTPAQIEVADLRELALKLPARTEDAPIAHPSAHEAARRTLEEEGQATDTTVPLPALFDRFHELERRLTALAATEGQWEASFEHALGRRVSWAVAGRLLQAADPAAERLVRAEAEIARSGQVGGAEQAEAWRAGYLREAKRMGDSASVADQYERLLLRARARVLEAALTERARSEAQYLLSKHMPSVPGSAYLSENSAELLGEAVRAAEQRATRELVRKFSNTPRFGKRLHRGLSCEAFSWVASEVEVADEVTARSTREG